MDSPKFQKGLEVAAETRRVPPLNRSLGSKRTGEVSWRTSRGGNVGFQEGREALRAGRWRNAVTVSCKTFWIPQSSEVKAWAGWEGLLREEVYGAQPRDSHAASWVERSRSQERGWHFSEHGEDIQESDRLGQAHQLKIFIPRSQKTMGALWEGPHGGTPEPSWSVMVVHKG